VGAAVGESVGQATLQSSPDTPPSGNAVGSTDKLGFVAPQTELEVSSVHDLKAYSPMFRVPEENLMLLKSLQSSNANDPMVVPSPPLKMTDASAMQPLKQVPPISCKELPKLTVSSAAQF
jgi:hypothetical protein